MWTPEEKTQGELLQRALDELNQHDPVEHVVPPFISIFRHQCAKARISSVTGKPASTAMELHEEYATLSEFQDVQSPMALIYREGKCRQCGERARSTVGRLVRQSERPPLHGRVAR